MGIFRDTNFVLQKLQTDKAKTLVYENFARNCVEQ